MSFVDDDAKEQIRQAIDIVELVGSYLPLTRQGTSFKGLCPFHDDTRPSLDVNPNRQSWRCWVCDKGGDIFSFVQQREGVGFREALELLAERAGIALRSAPKTQPGSPNDRSTLLKAAAWAERQFYECLLHAKEAEVARAYFDEQLRIAFIWGLRRKTTNGCYPERERRSFLRRCCKPRGWSISGTAAGSTTFIAGE